MLEKIIVHGTSIYKSCFLAFREFTETMTTTSRKECLSPSKESQRLINDDSIIKA
jgi:hypothetical protein